MAQNIIHRDQALFQHNRSAGACVFDSGITVVSFNHMGGQSQEHLNPDDLRALAKLLNEAVEHLPVTP
jgi:hypothetical protein